MSKGLGITSRKEDYSKWYTDIVEKADLAEHSPVRGCMIIKPHGYEIWDRTRMALDRMFKETGHKNAYFPLFVPKSFLAREAEHVEGFAKECAVVTHHRLKSDPEHGLIVDPEAKLEEELIIRPTSETVIWHTYKNWIQSYRDLPLLINQWANVVRWELRPRLFLRTAEFLWQEGHTAHADFDDAEREALTIIEIYRKFVEEWMAVPVLVGLKSKAETFAGADHTYTIEALTQDLRAIQAGTSHHLGTNFAKAFDVKFQSREGELEYVHATSWGVSTRLVGTLVMAHSDDNGLVVPPRLAPVQVVIVPVGIGKDPEATERVLGAVERIAGELREARWDDEPLRVEVDDRDSVSPGFKFNDWELKGACVRIEIGPRDLESGEVLAKRRDQDEKQGVRLSQVTEYVTESLSQMQESLFERALQFREANTHRVDSWDEFKAAFGDTGGGGFVVAHWDGTAETEAAIVEETKATIRAVPLKPLQASDDEPGKCVYSGKESARRVVFARAY